MTENFECVDIGCGPPNLSFTTLLSDRKDVKSIFFDKKQASSWQDDMMTGHASQANACIALELATARLLAAVTAPLLPRFAHRPAAAFVGQQVGTWPDQVELITPDTRTNLAGQEIFTPTGNTHA